MGMQRLKRALIVLLGGEMPYRDSDKSVKCEGMEDKYLFDFLNWSSQYDRSGGGMFINTPQVVQEMDANPSKPDAKPSAKIIMKPKDVLNELETVPTPFALAGIEEKIAILKDKTKLIRDGYSKREIEALIDRMGNRMKYFDNKEFFEKFNNTTDEKIAALVAKYELVMKTSDIFVPEFPDEAVKVMTDYEAKCKELFDQKPVFYVIAQPDQFRKAYEKRDPILLVQSPFGFYWQILGAWDEEMFILSEL
jgi:hypothetical protein